MVKVVPSKVVQLDNTLAQSKFVVLPDPETVNALTPSGSKEAETDPKVPNVRYQIPFIETFSTNSDDIRLHTSGSKVGAEFQGSHGKWILSTKLKNNFDNFDKLFIY